MRLFSRLFDFFTRESSDGDHATPPKTPRAGSYSGGAGVELLWPIGAGGSGSMSVATAYRCVQLLSESVAKLPIQYMRRRGEIFIDDHSANLHYLLNVQPDQRLSAFDFWRGLVQLVLLDGNAYVLPLYSAESMDVESLILCSRGSVSVDTITGAYTISDMDNGIYGRYESSDVIHVKGQILYGNQLGVSVLEYARQTLNIAAVGDKETHGRFSNGGSVRGLVTNDKSARGLFGEYADDELEKVATSIDERFRQGERIVSLPGDSDFRQISLSSTDMQFLESRKFTVREVCRFFGVHPSFVFDDTSNNYKSAEMANVAFLSDTLSPLLRKIECEFARKLIHRRAYGKRVIQFDRRGLYACDLDSRIKYQSQTIAAGIYTVNEWRREENKPPIDGGDKILVSANLRDLNMSDDAPTPDGTKTIEEDEQQE